MYDDAKISRRTFLKRSAMSGLVMVASGIFVLGGGKEVRSGEEGCTCICTCTCEEGRTVPQNMFQSNYEPDMHARCW